jgi:hypothetical protein
VFILDYILLLCSFERLLLNAATELEETKTLVATLTSSAATSRRIREAAAKEV